MENEIIKKLKDDEVIRFIAHRHRIDPKTLLMAFLTGQSKSSYALLDNEMEILHGLIKAIEQKIAI